MSNAFKITNVVFGSLRYFLAQRLTEDESIAFEKEFKRKEDFLYSKRSKKAKIKYEKTLREFDDMASKRIWSDQIMRKKQQVVTQRAVRGLSQSQHQLQQNKDNASQFPEFLDHQLLNGSRITYSWNCSEKRRDENKLSDQIDQLMQNIWPFETPYDMHLELLAMSKNFQLAARRNITTDILLQLHSRAGNFVPGGFVPNFFP